MNEQEMNDMLAEAFNNGYNEGHADTKRHFIELLKELLEKAKDIDAVAIFDAPAHIEHL